VRVRRGSGRAALRCVGSWGWVSAAGVVIVGVVMSVGVVVVMVVVVAATVATVCPMPVAAAIGRRVISAVTLTMTRV